MKSATNIALGLAVLLNVQFAYGAHHSPKMDIVVEPPSVLPEPAQENSQDMILHYNEAGDAYLCLEQQHGARLVILDVNEPRNIRVAASIATGTSIPWNFIQTIGGERELVRFRDGSGSALLDLRKLNKPQFVNAGAVTSQPFEILGSTGYLAFAPDANRQPEYPHGQDVQVIDATATPRLLALVTNVTRRASRPETGTTFLLGNQGLTVVRSLTQEEAYKQDQDRARHAN